MGVEDEDNSDDDDDFFVDLPVVARKYKSTPFQLDAVPQVTPGENSDQEFMDAKKAVNTNSDTDTSTDMDVDDENKTSETSSKANSSKKTSRTGDGIAKRRNKNKNPDKQLRKHSYNVTPTAERMVAPKKNADGHTSSYSFSSSSVVDDQGRRVTTDRRRYEDSTGRLKAAQEREIDGKKMRTTWSRQNKEDEGQHESICSSGSPEEFEALWQQTPFGEAQKMKVKGQLQSESDVEERGDVNDSSTGACHNGGSTDGEAEIINREE
ncbi:hypothetical protein F441_14345 [Phytophthora nicotianae CJ01A1]|uniref:Uncharacterized protein n=2 Tax=Phytophthora nicotianae TaxID=4792 RepID=W2WHS7_PHYNI|nr:hypothetical protein F441_14345 [Phytophthora nicotianae CJ01A1]